eukprot:7206999-Prorocentrum_lima.AAC.1
MDQRQRRDQREHHRSGQRGKKTGQQGTCKESTRNRNQTYYVRGTSKGRPRTQGRKKRSKENSTTEEEEKRE